MEKENPITNTKLRIVDASFSAFNQRGFQAVSMDEIAKQLRISKKTIYKFFGSKEELLEFALVELFNRLEARLVIWERQKVPKENLLRYFDILRSWRSGLSDLLRMELQTELAYLADRIENFERQILLRHLIGFLKRLRSDAVIDYPSPSREFAMTFFQLMMGLTTASEEHAAYFLTSLFRGITVKKKKKK